MARVKLIFPEKIIFSTTLPVRITDINYGNHVGNDAIVSILHEARVAWLTSLNYTELSIEGASLIMADIAVEYKGESFYGDILNIDICVGDITKKSFELYYKIQTKRNGETILISNAKTGLVCFDYSTKKVAELPTQFLQILGA